MSLGPSTYQGPYFFIGSYKRSVGWSWENGWVCPSNDHVDLYTREERLSGEGVSFPKDGLDWEWIEYDA